jgi:hypothetical protein
VLSGPSADSFAVGRRQKGAYPYMHLGGNISKVKSQFRKHLFGNSFYTVSRLAMHHWCPARKMKFHGKFDKKGSLQQNFNISEMM